MSASGRARDRLTVLYGRELEVARLVAEGLTNQGIADRLGLHLDTVKSHAHRAMGRVSATNRAHLVSRLVEQDSAARVELAGALVRKLRATSLDDGQRDLLDRLELLVTGRPS